MKMKLNMNVEELRREILEGARAVPLCKQNERSEQGSYTGKECKVEDGEKETSVTGGATEVGGREEEVSLEEGMLGWLVSSTVLLRQ